jgi:predicted MFS family arabinose efflux permease
MMNDVEHSDATLNNDGFGAPQQINPHEPSSNEKGIILLQEGGEEFGVEAGTETDFTVRRKYWIIFLSGLAALFSPLSSSIYYPAITELSLSYKVSIELINLTMTSYMVMSGIGPALVSDLADHIGRRPVYISTLSLYFAVNVALACQKSYPALLVLRMFQSLGASGSISLLYGTVSDLWPPSKRGRYVGLVTCGFDPLLCEKYA